MSATETTTRKRLPIPAGVALSGAQERCPNCHREGAEVGHKGLRKVVLCRHCNHDFGVPMLSAASAPVDHTPPALSVVPTDTMPDLMPDPHEGESPYQQAIRRLDAFKRDFPAWSDRDIQRHGGYGEGWLLTFRKSVNHDDPRCVRKAHEVIRLIAELRAGAGAGIRTEHRAAIALAAAGKHIDALSAAVDAAQAQLAELRQLFWHA